MLNFKKYLIFKKNSNISKSVQLVLFMMFVGMLFRLFLMRYRFAVGFDEVNYLKLGVSGHLNGLADILHTYWSPLLPMLISFFCGIFDNYEFAGRIISILAGTFLVIPVYSLGKYVYDEKIGLIAAGFVAIYPPLAFQSTNVKTEPVYMLFATISIIFGLLMLNHESKRFAFLAGLFTGLAYLTHPQGIGFFIVIAFWILFSTLLRLYLIRFRRMIMLLVILCFGFIITAAPYLIYLKKATGSWTLSAKGAANQQMEAHVSDEGQDAFRALDASNKNVLFDQIFHKGDFLEAANGGTEPVTVVRLGPLIYKYIENLANMLKGTIPEFLTTLPMILLGVGLFGARWQPQQGKIILYLVSFIVFFWLILIPLFHLNLRYLSPLWPLCAIWIAKGVSHIYGWLTSYIPLVNFSKRFAKNINSTTLAAVIILLVFFTLTFLPELGRAISKRSDAREYWADAVEQKKAGLWIKENMPGDKSIMSYNHAVSFYAGSYDISQSIEIPDNGIERILKYAKYRKANFLVLNERYKEVFPRINFLLSSENVPDGLELVYQDKDRSGFKTVIYKIL